MTYFLLDNSDSRSNGMSNTDYFTQILQSLISQDQQTQEYPNPTVVTLTNGETDTGMPGALPMPPETYEICVGTLSQSDLTTLISFLKGLNGSSGSQKF